MSRVSEYGIAISMFWNKTQFLYNFKFSLLLSLYYILYDDLHKLDYSLFYV